MKIKGSRVKLRMKIKRDWLRLITFTQRLSIERLGTILAVAEQMLGKDEELGSKPSFLWVLR